jgi:hypothetical protein
MRKLAMVGVIAVVGITVGLMFGGFDLAGATPPGAVTPVSVVNTATNPVPVSAADNAAFTNIGPQVPSGLCADGSTLCRTDTADDYTVPAGKVLVIQQVSFNIVIPAGEDISEADLNIDSGFANFVAPQYKGTSQSGDLEFTASEQTTIYVAAGQKVYGEFHRNTGAGQAFGQFSFTGYLATLPTP